MPRDLGVTSALSSFPRNWPYRRNMMKKTFAVALLPLLPWASLVACGGKKEPTTPVKDQPAMEQKSDAIGGATYGKKAGTAPPADDKASPNAPK